MKTNAVEQREAATFERSYPGRKDQVKQVRNDLAMLLNGCPAADDLILLASELSANAAIHSRSRGSRGEFTVRADVRPGEYVRLEIEDQGGPWRNRPHDDDRPHGLDIVAAIAADGNWGIGHGNSAGTRVVWVRLGWPGQS